MAIEEAVAHIVTQFSESTDVGSRLARDDGKSQKSTERIAFLNDAWIPQSSARISIFDRGFTLADTVYDSLRTFRHIPFKTKEHVDRLYRSLKVTRIDPGLTPEAMSELISEAAARNSPFFHPDEDFLVVVYVSRGTGTHPLRCGEPTVVVAVRSFDWSDYARFYAEGAHLVTASSRRQPSQCWDAKLKTTSRIHHTLAEIETAQVDPEAYCLLLDMDGNVAESRSSNFCIVRNGQIETPTPANILGGITLKVIFDLAKKNDIPIIERNIQPYDVYTADEAFLTATSFCVLPVCRFNGMAVGHSSMPGPVVRRLLVAFSELAGIDIVGQAVRQSHH